MTTEVNELYLPVIDSNGQEVDTRFTPSGEIPSLRDPAVAQWDGSIVERSVLEARTSPIGSEVPECPRSVGAESYKHNPHQCLDCGRRIRWVKERLDEEEQQETETLRVSGDFLFGLPSITPLWGTPDELLAAEGQGWMLAGTDGTGKTSTAIQYVKARLGLPEWDGHM